MTAPKPYIPEKPTWSEQDFSVMGWHDANIWATLALPDSFEYCVDLDYIFNWVHPQEGETYFKFWVAPVTMVFENASDIVLDIESSQGIVEVADFHMKNPRKSPNGMFTCHDFEFECQEGLIKVSATGFKMYVRKLPFFQSGQVLELKERGGVNFGRETYVL